MSRRPLAVCLLPLAAGCGPGRPADPYEVGVSPLVFKDDAPANRPTDAGDLPTGLIDHTGRPVDLTSYRGKRNLVLVVTRGLPESPGGVPCPYCVVQANGLMNNLANLRARDAEVLFLYPGPADRVADFVNAASPVRKKLPYPILLDQDMAACDRLGIRGDLAKPSTYIVDKAGRVVYAYVGQSRTDRPSVKAVLAQLDKLQPPAAPPPPAPAPPTPAAR